MSNQPLEMEKSAMEGSEQKRKLSDLIEKVVVNKRLSTEEHNYINEKLSNQEVASEDVDLVNRLTQMILDGEVKVS